MNWEEAKNCDGCGTLHRLSELEHIGRQRICESCMKESEQEALAEEYWEERRREW